MNGTRAQHIIVSAMATAVVVATVHDLTTKNTGRMPALRIPIGGFIATAALLGASGVAPEPSAMFAVLIATATVLGPAGSGFIDVLNRLLNNPPSAPSNVAVNGPMAGEAARTGAGIYVPPTSPHGGGGGRTVIQ